MCKCLPVFYISYESEGYYAHNSFDQENNSKNIIKDIQHFVKNLSI